jgi:sugar lactone lactonase YvrE
MVHCNFCNVMVQASAAGMPRDPIAMARPASPGGGGAAIGAGCVIAGIAIVGLLVVGGGVASWLLLRSAPGPSSPIVTISTPEIPTIPAIATAAAAKKAAPMTTWGEAGNGAGQLTDARSITVDMDENVYVADYDTLRVQKFDTNGKFQWIVQVPKDTFAGNKAIWGMAVDSKNVLWVNRTAALFKLSTADGKLLGTINGNYDDKSFERIGIDAVGNIATLHNLAGDTDLLLLDPNGKLRKRVKNVPEHGLAMDGAGNVYLSDSFGGQIEVIDPQGNVKSKFGSKSDKHTSRPGYLAVDGKGHIFAETGEGLDVFDQGGSYIKTIDTGAVTSLRSFAISSKGHLFLLGNERVAELDIDLSVGALP